ncbi:MAG: phosphatase, partial [Acidobacteriota bacterium]
CEDSDYVGEGGTAENYVRVLSPEGKIADFAKNIIPGLEKIEFAGSVFSPDRNTLFVNIMGSGITFAIWGDWKKFRS